MKTSQAHFSILMHQNKCKYCYLTDNALRRNSHQEYFTNSYIECNSIVAVRSERSGWQTNNLALPILQNWRPCSSRRKWTDSSLVMITILNNYLNLRILWTIAALETNFYLGMLNKMVSETTIKDPHCALSNKTYAIEILLVLWACHTAKYYSWNSNITAKFTRSWELLFKELIE